MPTIKIRIDSDERYPDYVFSDKYGWEVEVDEQKVEEWKRVEKEYNRIQREMSDAVEGR